MPHSVFANGRGIAHKGSGGMSAVWPDVCMTPPANGVPVPIPYANMVDAQAASGDKAAQMKQKEIMDAAKKEGHNPDSATQAAIMTKSSKFSKSSGDEAGTAGGVRSARTMGKQEFLKQSFQVKFEGKSVARTLDMMLHNSK